MQNTKMKNTSEKVLKSLTRKTLFKQFASFIKLNQIQSLFCSDSHDYSAKVCQRICLVNGKMSLTKVIQIVTISD